MGKDNEFVTFLGKDIEVKNGVLNLSEKKINDISEIVGLEELKDLKVLSFRKNQITEIKGLGTLTNLQELYLWDNQITEIKDLGTLTNLQKLYLNNNQITEIKGLGTLTNLQELYLNNNQITEIKGLGTLTNLQELYLKNNQITEIKGLENFTNLNIIHISGNEIPKNIIDKVNFSGKPKDTQNLINYCKGLKEKKRLKNENYKETIEEIINDQEYSQVIKELTEFIKKAQKYYLDDLVLWAEGRLNESRKAEKRLETITYIKKSSLVYEKVTFDKVISKTGLEAGILEELVEDLIANQEIVALIREGEIIFDTKKKKQVMERKDLLEKIVQLKKIIKVSEEIKLEMMRKTLKMNEELFLENIYDWADEFNFKIKGDLLIINQDTVDDFINALDSQFQVWNEKELSKSDKLG